MNAELSAEEPFVRQVWGDEEMVFSLLPDSSSASRFTAGAFEILIFSLIRR